MVNRILCIAVVFAVMLISCSRPEVKAPPRPAKIALVLGAGSSKGFAHIGVLKVLESNGIPVHMIIGTSAGSFVGSLYAYGLNAFQIQKMSFPLEKNDIVDLTIPDNGFIKGDKLEEYVNAAVKNTPLEKMRIPLYVVATDLQNGREVVFGMGNTGRAVRASCSIPGIFRPVRIEGRIYVDGGVVSPVAVDAARRMGADVVIAVDIASAVSDVRPETTIDTILQSISIMYSKLSVIQLHRADVVISPKVAHIAPDDFSKRHEAVLEGEKAALEALPGIQHIISSLRSEGRL